MKPFDDYPGEGNIVLKKMDHTNARREDGLWLMENAGQDMCAYCGISLVDDYYHWLLLNVDHVIPAKECNRLNIPGDWHHSFANAVLACSGCNQFDNHYTVKSQRPRVADGWKVSDFVSLRDRVFKERKRRILKRRDDEVRFFAEMIERDTV